MIWRRLNGVALSRCLQDEVGPSGPLPDQIFNLISRSYADIGGHVHFKTAADVPGDHDQWLLGMAVSPAMTTLDAVVGVIFGKAKKRGVKWTGAASTGLFGHRALVAEKMMLLCREPGNYAEVSGSLATLLIRRGCEPIDDAATVKSVIGKPIEWMTEGWYEREIGGATTRKILVGKPFMEEISVDKTLL